jgi:hypothetical protein
MISRIDHKRLFDITGNNRDYRFYLQNGLGSITHVVDDAGQLEESYTYDVYGKVAMFNQHGDERATSRANRPG